ncbi:hypothetical protein KKI24_28880 [bacterium]|nr:hypothetical protein [bacterium]
MGILGLVWKQIEEEEKREPANGIIEEAVIVPYNRFNANGLNVVAKFFERKGYKVTDTQADDKVRKKDGMPTKRVVFEFENGQKLEMLFAFEAKGNASIEDTMGQVFLAKIDGKKIPLTASKASGPHTAKALDKIVDFLAKLAPSEDKPEMDRKKLLAASQAELKPDVPAKGPTSTAAKLKAVMAKQEELTTLLGISQARIQEERSDNKDLVKTHAQLEKKLSSLTDTEASLKHELATLKSA